MVGVVAEVLKRVREERELRIHVNPQDLPLLRTAEPGIAASLPGRNFTLVADARVEAGGCIVESALGSLDGRLEVQLAGLVRDVACRQGPGSARMIAARQLAERMRSGDWVRRIGRIVRFVGLTLESSGPDARVGEICEIHARGGRGVTLAEVVGFSEQRVLLMPFGDLQGIEIGSEVIATGRTAEVAVGEQLLGRVIDGFGQPLDDAALDLPATHTALYPPPLNPLHRGMVRDILETGIRAIDTLLTLGRGQRIGIFAGSGVGKSTVLGMLAREVKADVSVIALIGERGREVRAFIEEGLSPEARARSVVVAATSDQPPLVRRRAAFLATAVAEHFRDAGLNVCLTMDSITRVAMAQREIGLAAGELPTARGYTPSVFTMLPRLLERGGVGNGKRIADRAVHRAGGRRRRQRADLRYRALHPRRPHRPVARHRASRALSGHRRHAQHQPPGHGADLREGARRGDRCRESHGDLRKLARPHRGRRLSRRHHARGRPRNPADARPRAIPRAAARRIRSARHGLQAPRGPAGRRGAGRQAQTTAHHHR